MSDAPDGFPPGYSVTSTAPWEIARSCAPGAPAAPQTHDYTCRPWTYDYVWLPLQGVYITEVIGWGPGVVVGDYILLPNGDGSVRLRIDTIWYVPAPRPPSEMWRARVTFAPETTHPLDK